jgi:hypothetical protein
MTAKTQTMNTYLVNGTYLVRDKQSQENQQESGRMLVNASSELKAIMTAASTFMAGKNYTWFTWLKVKAEKVEEYETV